MKNTNFHVVTTLNENVWRQFVKQHSQSNVFHTPEMFQVFSLAEGYDPKVWAAIDENDTILALFLPVNVSLKQGLLRFLTTRAVAYGGILAVDSVEGKRALESLLREYVRRSAKTLLFAELRNLSDISSVQATLQDTGFIYEDHLNYLIDLTRSPEVIMQSLGKRTRKNLRRALRRSPVVVEEVTTLAQLALCYDLLHRTYTSARIPLSSISLFESAFEILYPKQMLRCLLARVEDTYIATTVELLYKDTIYGWYGGLDRRYGNQYANEILMWHVLEWGAQHGYRVYDFGGAGKPDEDYGVRDFKAKFGGDLVCFGRNTYTYNPFLLSLSKFGYQLYRHSLNRHCKLAENCSNV